MHTGRGYAIIGATGGIGSALSRRLADAGARLALGARGADRLESLRGSLPGAHFARTVDASSTEQTVAFARAAAAELGRLDGIACCVGSIILKPADRTSDEEFEATLRQNLWPAFGAIRAAAGAMRDAGGSVLLFATAAALTGLPNHEAIAAAKGAVIALARSAAATYAPRGIRINVIAPGLVDTPAAAGILASEPARRASEAMHPLGRIGTPEDIAPLAAHLLSDEASWITGQVMGVDGGLATLRGRVKL
jgi:NAD(P)-dependent dehydrogenase (short-subunit alcohol dehydrogenase family)